MYSCMTRMILVFDPAEHFFTISVGWKSSFPAFCSKDAPDYCSNHGTVRKVYAFVLAKNRWRVYSEWCWLQYLTNCFIFRANYASPFCPVLRWQPAAGLESWKVAPGEHQRKRLVQNGNYRRLSVHFIAMSSKLLPSICWEDAERRTSDVFGIIFTAGKYFRTLLVLCICNKTNWVRLKGLLPGGSYLLQPTMD